jgi:hypothetical protein
VPSASFLGDFPHAAKHEDETRMTLPSRLGVDLIEGDKIDGLKIPVGAGMDSQAKTHNKLAEKNDVLAENP